MLGHKSATMTLDLCGHLFDSELDDIADRLDAAARTSSGFLADSLRTRGSFATCQIEKKLLEASKYKAFSGAPGSGAPAVVPPARCPRQDSNLRRPA